MEMKIGVMKHHPALLPLMENDLLISCYGCNMAGTFLAVESGTQLSERSG